MGYNSRSNNLLRIAKERWVEDRYKFNQYLIVLIVLLAATILAPKIAQGDRIYLLVGLVVVAVVAIVIVTHHPEIGLIGTLVGGILISYSGPGGVNAAIGGIAFMLFVWLLMIITRQIELDSLSSRTFKPVVFFALASILSFMIGQFSWFSFARNAPLDAQIGGLIINVLSIGAFLLTAYLLQDIRKLEFLTWFFIGLGMFYVVGRLLSLGIQDRLFQRGFAAGSMFWTWLVALSFSQVIINNKLRPILRFLIGGLVLATFYVAIAQAYDWKSGWLPPLVACAAIIGIRYWRKIWYFTILTIIPLYYIITSSIASDQYSYGTRMDAWRIILEIAKVSPILGLGFANYYWYTPLFPIRGWYVSFNSHSQFIDLIAQTGLLGLICFVWIFWAVGRLGLRLREHVPDGFTKAYVYGALGGLAGTFAAAALVDWVLPFVYNIGMNGFRASIVAWLFLGGLVCIERVVHNQNSGKI